jgi:hypothetical protein
VVGINPPSMPIPVQGNILSPAVPTGSPMDYMTQLPLENQGLSPIDAARAMHSTRMIAEQAIPKNYVMKDFGGQTSKTPKDLTQPMKQVESSPQQNLLKQSQRLQDTAAQEYLDAANASPDFSQGSSGETVPEDTFDDVEQLAKSNLGNILNKKQTLKDKFEGKYGKGADPTSKMFDIVENVNKDLENKSEDDFKAEFSSGSTPMKILAAIGIAIAGRGGPQAAQGAVNVVNSAIERDLEVQKLKYLKKKQIAENKITIFGHYAKMFDDLGVAERAAIATYQNILSKKADVKSKNIKNNQARLNLSLLSQKLKQNSAQNFDKAAKLYKEKAGQEVVAKTEPMTSENLKVLQQSNDPRAKLAIVGFGGFATDPKGKEKTSKMYSSYNRVAPDIDQLLKLNQEGIHSPNIKTTALKRAQASAIVNRIIGSLKPLENEASNASDQDMERLKSLIANPNSFTTFSDNNAIRLNDLKKYYRIVLEAEAKAAGYTSTPYTGR